MDRRTVALTEAPCKTLLQKSKASWTDYHINPYTGCAFGCSFCYVPSLRKFRGQEWETWGTWAQAKANAVEVLRREMRKVEPQARIMIGSATDAWQPAEKRLEITRGVLEVLSEYPNPVSIITRSPLLIRDIPILQRLAGRGRVHVGLSLSTFDDRARRVFEPHAPAVAGRENLARRLVAAKIPTSLFWMPMLPGVSDNPAAVREYVERAAALGVESVVCGLLNYRDTLGPGYSERLSRYYALCAASGDGDGCRKALGRAALAREVAAHGKRLGVRTSVGFA